MKSAILTLTTNGLLYLGKVVKLNCKFYPKNALSEISVSPFVVVWQQEK